MESSPRVTRRDSQDLGFAVDALYLRAISGDEFHDWCYSVIEKLDVDDTPQYIFELATFDGWLVDLHRIIGFVPGWQATPRDEAALVGIGIRRGIPKGDNQYPRDVALAAEKANVAVVDRFREAFPFIAYR